MQDEALSTEARWYVVHTYSGYENKVAATTFFSCSAIKAPLSFIVPYLVSLCKVCFLQKRQYLFSSMRSGVFFLFFMVL